MAGRKARLDRLSRLNTFQYPKRKARPPSPRENATFMQIIFVSWLLPLLEIGMQREITEDDLYPTLYEDQSDHIGDKLEILWGNHLEVCKAKGKKPSLVKILCKAYALKFFFFGLFSLAEETVFRIVQVIALGYILDYFEGNYLTTMTGTLLFGVGGLLLGSVSFLISYHWSIHSMHHVCTYIRLGLSSMIYRKMMVLNPASLRSSTVGQIVTMIASDLNRFDRKHVEINYIWVAPIHLVVVIYMLYYHYRYGVTTLLGLLLLIIFTIIQYALLKKFLQMRQKRVDSADIRIRAVVEIINAFYTIKLHCWERFFQDQAMENRKQELKIMKATMYLRLLNTAIAFVVTKMSVFLTLLLAFILEPPGEIHSKRLFVTLVLYEHVRVNTMILFPQGVNDIAELLISTKRIQEFLLLDELEPSAHSDSLMEKVIGEKDKSPKIEVENLTCWWTKGEGFHLENVTFQVLPGQLAVVAGPVASGKTTLITALLGEIPPDEGHILIMGRIAYVPQTPVIFPGSIKRNIIFGYGINEKWYREVVKMCDLVRDFEQFPFGDQSLTDHLILSGSQRAKINIARAVYANADVYLLDDPLQSLDTKYHRVLLESVIHGALADKVVLLVTHQIHFLEDATDIILIHDGSIIKKGTYKELLSEGIEFYRDLDEEDEFHFSDGSDDLDDEPVEMMKQLLPDAAAYEIHQPLRQLGSLQFQVNDGNQVRKISQSRKTPILSFTDIHGNIGNVASVMEKRGSKVDPDISMVVQDEDAFDDRDRIKQPARISFKLYYEFLRAGASKCALLFLLLVCLISQSIYTLTDIWIENWAHDEGQRYSEQQHGRATKNDDSDGRRAQHFFYYCGLVSLVVTSSFARSFIIFRTCLKASSNLFEKLLKATIEGRLSFFEHTGAANAINRLTKDIVMIDDSLPQTLLEVLAVLLEIIGALVVLVYCNPWFVIPAVVYALAIMIVYKIYHLTAADLKRIEGKSRSPVYAHLSRTLQGVSTIRAFGQEQAFVMIFDRLQDNHTSSKFLLTACQSWFGVIMDVINIMLLASISLSFFYSKNVNPAIVGLAISKLIELSILSQFAAGEMSSTETQMISVERVLEYTEASEDGQFEVFDGLSPPAYWPTEGRIEFTNLFSTPPGHKTGLKNINLVIEGGEWVGIVGKTGSGKTTLLNSLFRVAESQSGKITIDGQDISKIGLHNLRRCMSFIPQTPCMFQGTVRQNIDPVGKYTDEKIWDVLRECNLADGIQKMGNGLDSNVTEYGANFSAGQRQLICLARVLLERNRIICCDEPTASLDGYTQTMMVSKLKEHFENITVLLVAHRIPAVVDCDRILVMESGEIVEEGDPYELLKKTEGPFYELVRHLGKDNLVELVKLAETTKQARDVKKKLKLKRKSLKEPVQKTKKSLIKNIISHR